MYMSRIHNLFMCHSKKALLKQYLLEFQERIDKGHQLVCSNKVTQKSFYDYRKDVCELLAGYKKNFGNESFADFYIIHSIDTLTISAAGVETENTSDEERCKQIQKYTSNLESIANSIVRDFQLKESKLQTRISLAAVCVAIIVPCILNCCSHTIDKEQYEILIKTIQTNSSTHLTQQDSISHSTRK